MTGAAPTRIVHIIPRDGLGGVETAARSMAARNDLACDFHLLFIAGPTLAEGNARVEAPSPDSSSSPLAYLATLRRCLALDPDLVVASLWRSVPLLFALRLLLPRAKLVMTVNSGRAAHMIDAALFRIGVRLADEVWSDSKAAIVARGVVAPHRVISFVPERLVPNPEAPPRPRFAAWARIDRDKGFDVALELIAALVGRGQDPRFDLYGPDGGERSNLEAQAKRLNIVGRVHFHGPIDHADLRRVAADASFFLLPSRIEGMAIACVEAMQFGLVPVVTPAGEMKRYVIPGKTGVIIDPDRLDAAVRDICGLIEAPDRYVGIRSAAVSQWTSATLYADDICAAALALVDRSHLAMSVRRA